MFKTLKKESFASLANSSLVGILITIGDVTDIFAISLINNTLIVCRLVFITSLFI